MDRVNEGGVQGEGGNTADRADQPRKHGVPHYEGGGGGQKPGSDHVGLTEAGGGSNRGSRGPHD